jgi:hypothetical protein
MKKQPTLHALSRSSILLLSLAAVSISFSSACALTIQLVTTFSYPNAKYTTPTAINDQGEIAGYFKRDFDYVGFIRKSDGSFRSPIVEPNDQGGVTVPTGINGSRLICGYFRSNSVHTKGFFLRGQTYTEFDVEGSFNGTWIYGVNNAGDFVGYYDSAGGGTSSMFIDVAGTLTAFNLPDGTAYGMSPSGINNLQEVVGNYDDYSGGNSYSFGFYRDAAGNFVYPLTFAPHTDTTLTALNDQGQIVGFYGTYNDYQGVLTTLSGDVVTYQYPGAKYTQFTGINNNGDICGWYKVTNGPAVGLIAHVAE